MPVLPVLSGCEVVSVFAKFGWSVARQRGSHIILIKPDHMATLSVPEITRSSPEERCAA